MLRCYFCSTFCRRLYGSVGKSGREARAKSIKSLNSENKNLFGDLLETAQEKRVRRRKNESIDNENDQRNNVINVSKNKEMSSEIWWWEKSSKTISIRFKNHQQSLKTQEVKSTHMTPKDTPQKILSAGEKANINSCLGREKESANKSQNDSQQILTQVRSADLQTHPITPPPFIIKHASTFPLENINGKRAGWALPVEEILRVSMDLSREREKEYTGYPSVSKILNATMSDSAQAALQRWEEKMTEKLGLEGFIKYKKGLLDHGKLFHETVQRVLSDESPPEFSVDPAVQGCFKSLQGILSDFSGVKALESHVVHSQLMYHGIIDCVAMYRGKPYLIEWKKSDSQKSSVRSTYDAPLQVAAYMGALNYDDNYNFKVQGGLVVVAYTDGSPAHSHLLSAADCSRHWRSWLQRLTLYWASASGASPMQPLHAQQT